MDDISLGYGLVLLVLGLIAGVINTLAGGGSNLTIPALMISGMPPDVANATNRVGVLLQSISGVRGFQAKGRMPSEDLPSILLPTLLGGLVGGVAASYAPEWLLKPALLATMLSMAALMLLKPDVINPPEGTPRRRVAETVGAWGSLFLAGVYGGFVQAGVGFVLVGALAGTLRYDLVAANALKVLCTLVFTVVALAIFIVNDQVAWAPGIILAVGSTVGAWIGVNIALTVSSTVLKWVLFVMTLCGVLAALVK